MPILNSSQSTTYALGDITSLDNDLQDFHDSILNMQSEVGTPLRDLRWTELGAGIYQWRVRFTDGRLFRAEGMYPTISPMTEHSVNTGTDTFTDSQLSLLQAARLAWIKVVVQHQVSEYLREWEYL